MRQFGNNRTIYIFRQEHLLYVLTWQMQWTVNIWMRDRSPERPEAIGEQSMQQVQLTWRKNAEKVYVHRARCATYHHHAVRIHNTLTRTKECPYRYWQIKLNHEILSSFNGEFQAHCGTASSIGGSPLWWRWQTSGQTKGWQCIRLCLRVEPYFTSNCRFQTTSQSTAGIRIGGADRARVAKRL